METNPRIPSLANVSYEIAGFTVRGARTAHYKGKRLHNFTQAIPAFKLSETLRDRISIRAKNDLRIRDFVGETTNVTWQQFSQDRSFQRQFPDQASSWDDFKDTHTRGMTPSVLVEKVFPQYGLVELKISKYTDNSFHHFFPLKVVAEVFQRPLPEIDHLYRSEALSKEQRDLFDALATVALEIQTHLLQKTDAQKLVWVSEYMKGAAEKCAKFSPDSSRFKDIFYGEILATLAGPISIVQFNFDGMPLTPNLGDFIYMSTLIGTSNIPSEITPITSDARLVTWMQLIVSYFLLALNVAAIIRLLGLQ